MKNFLFLSIVLICIATACNDGSSKTKTSAAKELKPPEIPSTCYLGVSGKDSITLTVRKEEELVTGDLAYLFYEKDKSRGTFSGRMKGDTLFADYTYTSEGETSTREIAFLQKDNTLTEGSGDAMELDGKMTFKDPTKVKFGSSFVLQKVECKK
jgi:hypothetical protein